MQQGPPFESMAALLGRKTGMIYASPYTVGTVSRMKERFNLVFLAGPLGVPPFPTFKNNMPPGGFGTPDIKKYRVGTQKDPYPIPIKRTLKTRGKRKPCFLWANFKNWPELFLI